MSVASRRRVDARWGWIAISLSCLELGCAEPSEPATEALEGTVLTALEMTLDPKIPVGSETYQCRLLDVGGAKGKAVHALRWLPPTGAIALHHAMMFATNRPGPTGPVSCDALPPPVAVLPLYAPGAETVAFAEGVSIEIPESAVAIFVQLHLLRIGQGPSDAEVDLLADESEPIHLADWVDGLAPVPTLDPHAIATSVASCGFDGPAHIAAAWPHMHRLGSEFHGTVVRADGTREPLVDVDAWDFGHQPLYPAFAELGEGDRVETACTWENTTDATVVEGFLSSDEMCNQGLVVWPRESAHCIR